MQTIINKSGTCLTVIILAAIMVAFFQPTSANACCKRKPNFGCCGNGKCNILCCNCNGGCNVQCEKTNCNTLEWVECVTVIAGCAEGCTEVGPAAAQCIRVCLLTLGNLACLHCYVGEGATECLDDSSISRDNFFESIANFDGESSTVSRRDMRRFIRQEKKRTGMVLNAPFSEMFDAFDTDDNQLIDRFEFDNEEVDYYLMEPDDNQLIDRGEFDNEKVDY